MKLTMAPSHPDLHRRWLTTSLMACAGAGFSRQASSASDFVLFDALLHRGKPNLQRTGLMSLPPVANIWRPGFSHDEVDEEGLRLTVKKLSRDTTTFFIDIENWPVLKTTPPIRRDSISKLLDVVNITRKALPSAKFGFYGLPPAITYWPLVDSRPTEYADWRDTNRELETLAEVVDFIFPSLYTFYDDRTGWLTYASKTIKEARRYGKPVYPFLWFEYHDSNLMLRNREIETNAWKEELKFCRAQCDGIALWGGSERGWSESAKWWQAVRAEFHLPA